MGFGLHTPNYSLSKIAMEGHTSTRVLPLELDNPSFRESQIVEQLVRALYQFGGLNTAVRPAKIES